MSNCKKCNHDVLGNYCSNCATPAVLTRINGRYILGEVVSVLNFDKGLLYTVRELALRPGSSIRRFIQEDRSLLVKPIIFVIVCSLIYTFAQYIFHFEEGYLTTDMGVPPVTKTLEWIQGNYGYANIFMGVFIGLWTKIFFRRAGFNIYEILILIFFTMGMGMLIYTISGIAEGLTKLKTFHIGGIVAVIYSVWAIGSFFGERKVSNYIKGFFAYMIGCTMSIVLVIVIGVLIYIMNK